MPFGPDDVITVNIRSYVTPSEQVEGFETGKQLQMKVFANTALEDLVQQLFSKNRNHIGFKVVNGKVVKDKILLNGDVIEIHRLMGGG